MPAVIIGRGLARLERLQYDGVHHVESVDIDELDRTVNYGADRGTMRLFGEVGIMERQKEEEQIVLVWQEHDEEEKGALDAPQFAAALRSMQMGLPTPLVHILFGQLDEEMQRGVVTYRQFLDFVYSEQTLEFGAEFHYVFMQPPLEMTLEMNPVTQAVVVYKLNNEALKENILETSEIHMIGDTLVQDLRDRDPDNFSIELIENEILEADFPLRITFKKEVTDANIPLMNQDEDMITLHKSQTEKRNKEKIKKLKEAGRLRHCEFCPEMDTHKDKENLSLIEKTHLLFEDESYSTLSFLIISFVMCLIFLSTASYVISSLRQYHGKEAFITIEWFVSICFTIEYSFRIASCRSMWSYFWKPLNLVDFLAVIPFWIEITFADNGGGTVLRVIRVVRLARTVRLLRSPHFREYLDVFQTTLERSSHAFGLIVTILGLFIIVCASLVYEAEEATLSEDGEWVSRGESTLYISIPAAMYWCVVTMTTVGYGDMYPLRFWGKVVGIGTMLMGLLVIALPVIIIGGNFEEVYGTFRKRGERRQRTKELELDAKINSVPYTRVEEYFDKLNRYINRASEDPESETIFFTEEDVSCFIEEGFDTKEKVISLLKSGDRGLHFFPREVPRYKLYVLFKVFGKRYRGIRDLDPFINIRNQLLKKTRKFVMKDSRDSVAGM